MKLIGKKDLFKSNKYRNQDKIPRTERANWFKKGIILYNNDNTIKKIFYLNDIVTITATHERNNICILKHKLYKKIIVQDFTNYHNNNNSVFKYYYTMPGSSTGWINASNIELNIFTKLDNNNIEYYEINKKLINEKVNELTIEININNYE